MHDNHTVAFDIYLGKKVKKDGRYRSPFITIWHVDPEKDGTDDSCGWFIRSRHVEKRIIDKVAKDYEFEWDRTYTSDSGHIYNCGWFNPEGENVLSVQGIVLDMYVVAAKEVFGMSASHNPGKVWEKVWRFINKHHAAIAHFSENNTDSMRDTIVRKFEIGTNTPYTAKSRHEMIQNCASVIVCDIMRKNRPGYKHPRWHIHHWKIQFHPFKQLKRLFWDKCHVCGKRGFTGPAYGQWSGNKIAHEKCHFNSEKAAK